MTFWTGETYAIVKAMKATGNRPGVIQQWKDQIAEWSNSRPNDRDAAAVNAWLPHWQVRPFYTSEELAPMWPALAIAIGHTNYWPSVMKSPRRLEFELDYAGLPWFEMHGRKFYIVEQIHKWRDAAQEERENAFTQ